MADGPNHQQAGVSSDLARFRAFWREVDDVRTAARTGAIEAAAARARLLAVLRDQEAEVVRSGGAVALANYREAQYVMAAVADDTLVRLQWTGADTWMMHPLETDLFGSRCAGQLVFDRIEHAIAASDSNARAVSEIYVAALALGFEGKYAGVAKGPAAIADCRHRLRGVIVGDGAKAPGPLVPQCYQSTMNAGSGRLLRSPRVWWWGSLAVIGIWLIVSSLLWREITTTTTAQAARTDSALRGASR